MAARDVSGGGLAHHGGSSAFKQEGDRAGDKEDKEGERALRNGRKEVHFGIPNIAPFSRKRENILNLCIFNLYVLYVLKVVAQSAYINNFNSGGWRDVSVSSHTHFSFRGLRFNF